MQISSSPSTTGVTSAWKNFGFALVCLGVVLGALFARSFEPGQVLFANDSPLGLLCSEAVELPAALKGYWADLNWIGGSSPSASPSYSTAVWLVINSPVTFAKFYAPISLLTAGLCAWVFFRKSGFSQWTSVLGGLATTLNMNTFSNACWGLPTRALTLGAAFLALAALSSATRDRPWTKRVLAGLAVGLGIMEGFDIGAIFSLYIAAFALCAAWVTTPGSNARRLVHAGVGLAIVAGFAAFISACTLSTLIGTQIQGIVGTQQDSTTREQRWDQATMWSLPKMETLRVIVPGLFGYRMDAPEGGNYWGSVGQQPGWDQTHVGLARHSGSGEYAGVLVVLIAAFALVRSLQQKQTSFSETERRLIWFWAGAALVSLLLAFGRHAPFYRIVYALPYFNTIRNPIKFMHPFQMAVLVLFGYGLEGLYRSYLAKDTPKSSSMITQFQSWWKRAVPLDRPWAVGSLVALGLCALAVLGYASSSRELQGYLLKSGFPQELAQSIAHFSLLEAVWSLVFLAFGVGMVLLIMSGACSGRRAIYAGVVLGILIAADLARGDSHWINYYDYRVMYSSNSVIDELRDHPYEHRVAARLAPLSANYLASGEAQQIFAGVTEDWLQHKYQFYNIQSLDIVQMPRMPEMDATYLAAIYSPLLSASEFTGLDQLIGKLTNHVDALSQFLWQQFSPNTQTTLQGPAAASLKAALLESELNRVLQGSPIYDTARFNGVRLSEQTQAVLGQTAAGRDIIRLNRLLLEDAYPSEIARKSQLVSYARLWQLTNTRLILGMKGFLPAMNSELDPKQHSFRVHTAFNFAPRADAPAAPGLKPEDITATPDTNGTFAVFEYDAALPRALLFSRWQVMTNDEATLRRLADPGFDPHEEVFVAAPAAAISPSGSNAAAPGKVAITFYKPKDVKLQAEATAPSVLLLNDKFDPNWKVTVDQQPATLLRCNYIMRGVALQPGSHQVEFRYAPPHWTLWVSLAGVAMGLALCGFLALTGQGPAPVAAGSELAPSPKPTVGKSSR